MCLACAAHAQLDRGVHFGGVQTTLVAGDIYVASLRYGTSMGERSYAFSLTPTYGYAIARNWLVGAAATLGYSREKEPAPPNYTAIVHDFDIGFAPFSRLYLDLTRRGRLKAFALGSIEFASTRTRLTYPTYAGAYNNSKVVAAWGGGLGYFGRKTILDVNVSGVGIRLGVYKIFGVMKK